MHGLERRIGGRVSFPDGTADITPAIERLRARLSRHPGVIIEDKRVAVAVHWRTAPDAEADARARWTNSPPSLALPTRSRTESGPRDRPVSAGKGEGIRALMQRRPMPAGVRFHR
jgi:trehalose 6-phosphate phosphatase